MSEPLLCKHRVWHTWGSHACGRAAKRDGFCGTHHPDAFAARNAKSEAKIRERLARDMEKMDARRERERRADCFDDLLAALKLWDSGCRVMDGPAPNCECYGCRTRAAIAKAEGK